MKSATLKFAFVFLCMFSLFGCEHSIDKEKVLPNNPVIPYTFSIIGKKYVCDGATQEYAYVADILYFFSADSMVYYSTASKDFALDKALHTDYGIYKLKANNLTIIFGIDERPFVLKDTATLYSSWWEQTFLLNP